MAKYLNRKGTAFVRGTSYRYLAAACSAAALSVTASAAAAQTDCSFFSGQTVELVVPFNPGGGFDLYGRMVAAHMGPKLGAESMIVRNQPGAGGLLATNQIWNAPADGLLIQVMNASGMIASELGGAPGVAYESAGFSWIGRITEEPDVVTVGFDSEIDSIEALQALSAERPVRIGSTGLGDDDYISAQIMTMIFDLNSEIIVGFSGAPEVYASLARGEIDIFSSSYGSASRAQTSESAKILWLFEAEPDEDFPDYPAIGEFLEGDNLALVKASADVGFGSRALAGPPGMSADRLQCLRDAFDATMTDPAFLADAIARNLPVGPYSGEGLAEVIAGLMENPPAAYIEILRESYQN